MLLRSFLFKSSLITGFIILCLITSGIALATLAPFHPGNVLFPIQNFAEQQAFLAFPEPIERSDYALVLLERRINDVNIIVGTENELTALIYLDKAVNQSTIAISSIPQGQGENIRFRLLTLAQLAYENLKLLTVVPTENLDAMITIQTKLQTLISMVSTSGVKNSELSRVNNLTLGAQGKLVNPIAVTMLAGGLIPFPPGSPGAVHAFYPLIGQHILTTCNTCHNTGKYLGTPNTCTLCHDVNRPDSHYQGLPRRPL